MAGIVKYEHNEVSIQVGGRWLHIGSIDPVSRTLKVHKTRDLHLMNVWKAYGFPQSVMDSGEYFDNVLLHEQYKDGDYIKNNYYFISREDIVLYGKEYQAEGYEKQYFITLDKLKEYKAE